MTTTKVIWQRTGSWTDQFMTPQAERRAGVAMLVIAVIGVVTASVGALLGWRLVDGFNRSAIDTLDVTIDALDSVEASIDIADRTATSTSAALVGLESTLNTLSQSLVTGADVIDDTSRLTATSGPALADASSTMRQLETVGDGIDSFLDRLSSVPLAPSLSANSGLGPTFGRLAETIEPLSDDFAAATASLDTFESSLGELRSDVGDLATTIGGINQELADADILLDQYRSNVVEAQVVATRSRGRLVDDQNRLRFIIVVAAFNFAAAQLVPLWLGLQLLAGGTSRREGGDNVVVSDDVTPSDAASGGRGPARLHPE